MVDKKRAQQLKRQRAARAAMAAAVAHRKRVRRRLVGGVVGAFMAVVAGIAVVLVITGGDDEGESDEAAASTTAPTTIPAVPSAAGQPCVPVQGDLPAGAPPVPVKVGPPPAALVTEDLRPGTGPVVNPTDTLTVTYIGVSCSTGAVFDSSYARNEPATFPLSGVIPGWQQGIPGMQVGGSRLLGIPPELAYGPQGSPPVIAPGETLWFVVDVLDAKPA